ncbi:hypothetical protein U1Q18_048046 [Sarracenia purpurea var. burkii]
MSLLIILFNMLSNSLASPIPIDNEQESELILSNSLAGPIPIDNEQKSELVSSSAEQNSKNNFSWNLWNLLPIGGSTSQSIANTSTNPEKDFNSEEKIGWTSLFNKFLKSFYKQPSRNRWYGRNGRKDTHSTDGLIKAMHERDKPFLF